MNPKELLKEIFKVDFEEQSNIFTLRQFEHKNAFCCNKKGDIIGICACENDFTNLKISAQHFKQLEYLNLSDNNSLLSVEFDMALPQLVHVDVSDCALSTIQLPKGFIQLKDIYLQGNSLIEVILKGKYPQVRLLDIANNDKLQTIPENLIQFPKLENVFVKGSPILLGEENLSETNGNAWNKIRGYLAEFAKGSKPNYRAKMIIVGNGRVGKTSMAKRLKGLPFNDKEEYTHGISLGELTNKELEEIRFDDFSMKVWDFGGQEIFYATHQFFMTNTAIYVLAWTNYENVKVHIHRMETEGKAVMSGEKWRKEQNWLENIRTYAKSAPILMIQTHCDKIEHRLTPNSSFSEAPYEVTSCNFSAEKDIGLLDLKQLLSSKLSELPYFGKEYPVTYDNAIEEIETEKAETPFISSIRFNIICDEAGIDAENRADFLSYLNETGIVVHYPTNEQLKDKIFIDPVWLTSSVYALLNKKLESKDGKMDDTYIDNQLVALYKTKGIEIAKKDLIALLKSFKLIFETVEQEEEPTKIYIYPDYLPPTLNRDQRKLYRAIKSTLKETFTLKFTNYLPENVLINIISHYGPDTTDDFFWKNGICFTTEEGQIGIIEFDPKTEYFTVFTSKNKSDEKSQKSWQIQREICKIFNELGRNTAMEVALNPNDGFVSWEELTNPAIISEFNCVKHPEEFPIVNDKGKIFCFVNFAHLAIEHYRPKIKMEEYKSEPEISLPNVYFSYAWQDEDNPDRELLVSDIYSELIQSGFQVKRDKEECAFGEYIDEFMKKIGEGDLILVFLSKKYLKSIYCMTELFSIAQNSGWDKFKFKDRILPILVEKVDFGDEMQEELLDYWEEIEEKKVLYKKRNAGKMAGEAIMDLDQTIDTSRKISKLLFWVKKLNRGNIELYTNNDFAVIKNKIKERFTNIPYFQDTQSEQFYQSITNLGRQISEIKSVVSRQLSQGFRELSIKIEDTLNGIEDLKSFHQDQQALLQQLTKQIQLNTSDTKLDALNQKLDEQFQAIQQQLPQHIITLWKEANNKPAMSADVKGKLKLKFNLLPFLVYEKEVSLDVKKVFKDIIQDIKNGHYFTKPA